MSTKEGQSDSSIEWRRSKVLELTSEGYSQREIAQKLQIGKSVVNRDILYLRKQAQENLMTHETVPDEYQNCMTGLKKIIKLTSEIVDKATDPKTRLQALSQLTDGYRYILELTTNGVVITDAIKFVQTNKEKLTTMSSKEDDNSKESEEPDYDKYQLEEKQEEETGELSPRNNKLGLLNIYDMINQGSLLLSQMLLSKYLVFILYVYEHESRTSTY